MRKYDYKKYEYKQQDGFTLLELMVVTAMVAIIAAIGYPSYQKYIIQNAEQSAQAEIKQIQVQLDKWRSSRLTYLGFMPELGETVCGDNIDFCYDNDENTVVYIPLGSDENNYRYMLTIVDGSDSSTSLIPSDNDVNITAGRSWKVFATPQEDGPVSDGRKIMLTSTGVQCMTKDETVSITSTDCGSHYTSESW